MEHQKGLSEPGRIESVVIILSAVLSGVLTGACYSDGILVAEWVGYFGKGSGTTAWLGSVVNGLAFCMAPVAGMTARRFGTRKVYTIAGLANGAATTVSAFSPNVYVALICKITTGVAYAFNVGIIASYLIARFKHRAALANGIYSLGIGCGNMLFPFIINASLNTYGWRGCCMIIGGLTLNHVPVGLLLHSWSKQVQRDEPLIQNDNVRSESVTNGRSESVAIKINNIESSPDTPLDTIIEPQVGLGRRKSTFRSLTQLDLFKKKLFIILLIHHFLLYMGVSIIYVHIVAGFHKLLNLSIEQARLSLSIIGVTNLFARFFVCYMSQHPRVDTLSLHLILNFLLAVEVAIIPLGNGLLAAIVISASIGICTAGFGGLGQLIVAELIGQEYIFMSFGYLLCFGGIGYLIGGPIAGWVYDLFGDYSYSFYFGGIILVLCILVVLPEWIKHCVDISKGRKTEKVSKETRNWIASAMSLTG